MVKNLQKKTISWLWAPKNYIFYLWTTSELPNVIEKLSAVKIKKQSMKILNIYHFMQKYLKCENLRKSCENDL